MQKRNRKKNRIIFPNFRNAILLAFIILLYNTGCGSRSDSTTSRLEVGETTQWIGDNKPMPEKDSLFYLDDPALLFRKEFAVNGNLKSAKLLITAAGYYRVSINGQRVGQNRLDPAWTDFSKRIYYSEYDITNLLNFKNKCIGVTLENGFIILCHYLKSANKKFGLKSNDF